MKKGIFEGVSDNVMQFLAKHSGRLCPNGKYDNRVICSQMDIIRLIKQELNDTAKIRKS